MFAYYATELLISGYHCLPQVALNCTLENYVSTSQWFI